jgi:PAS domain S-box-containing protein
MVTGTGPLPSRALQEANARLRLLIDSVQGGLTIIEGSRVVYVNNQLSQMLGYSKEELKGMSELDLAAPQDRERVEQVIQEAESLGLPLEELEFWAVHKDGSQRFVRNRYSAGIVGDETPLRFVVTADLTEGVLAKQVMSQQQEVMRQITEIGRALAAADDPEAMLHAVAAPAMRSGSAAQSGAHVALLIYVDMDAEGKPEWASVEASIGEPEFPSGTRFYLPGASETDLLLSSSDTPLVVADMHNPQRGVNEQLARMMDSLDARAFIALPLRAGLQWQGILAIAWPDVHQFRSEEEDLYELVASQLAAYVQRLRQREEAEHRAIWSQTAAEVSRAASTVLETEALLQQVVNLVQERFELYYAGLFLVNQQISVDGEPRNWAVLRVGTGEAGRQMVAQGHKLEIGGESMIGQCVSTKLPRIAMDVGEEAVRFANPLLPETRTELALPLMSRGQALGALTIQSRRQAAFLIDDIAVLQTMADQLAIAIDNADLIRQAQARAEREQRVRAIADQIHRGASAEAILRSTLMELNQMLGASKSVIRLGTQAKLNAELGELASEGE